jgi:hypothetical protein
VDDVSLIQWIVGQTGLAGLAAFSIWQMKQWHDDSVRRNRENLDEEIRRGKEALENERADKSMLLDVLRQNTETKTRLVEAIGRIDTHIGNLTKRVDNIT